MLAQGGEGVITRGVSTELMVPVPPTGVKSHFTQCRTRAQEPTAAPGRQSLSPQGPFLHPRAGVARVEFLSLLPPGCTGHRVSWEAPGNCWHGAGGQELRPVPAV